MIIGNFVHIDALEHCQKDTSKCVARPRLQGSPALYVCQITSTFSFKHDKGQSKKVPSLSSLYSVYHMIYYTSPSLPSSFLFLLLLLLLFIFET